MTEQLTICIPIGPGHERQADHARESVKAQTVTVKGISYIDRTGAGAGFARNRLLQEVDTKYVAFLDADDWLEPDFAEKMIAAAENAGEKYVYSGWYEEPNGIRVAPPDRCYCFDNGWQVHLVTAIVRTQWAKDIGGFDEDLPGMEDTDFFHRLHEAGHCGQGIVDALVHYEYGGFRSAAFKARPDYVQIKETIGKRYHKTTMSCCGIQPVPNPGPYGEQQPGDVLAEALGSARVTVGRATGRIYPRAGYGEQLWVNREDAVREPTRFRIVDVPPERSMATPDFTAVDRLMANQRQKNFVAEAPDEGAKPTAANLRRMAGL